MGIMKDGWLDALEGGVSLFRITKISSKLGLACGTEKYYHSGGIVACIVVDLHTYGISKTTKMYTGTANEFIDSLVLHTFASIFQQ